MDGPSRAPNTILTNSRTRTHTPDTSPCHATHPQPHPHTQHPPHIPVRNVHPLHLDLEAARELVQNVGGGGRREREHDARAPGAACWCWVCGVLWAKWGEGSRSPLVGFSQPRTLYITYTYVYTHRYISHTGTHPHTLYIRTYVHTNTNTHTYPRAPPGGRIAPRTTARRGSRRGLSRVRQSRGPPPSVQGLRFDV